MSNSRSEVTRGKTRAPRSRRCSAEERVHILKRFELEALGGKSTTQVLKMIGVPRATFYSWIANGDLIEAPSPLADNGRDIGLNTAIRVLASDLLEPVFEREQALFRLMAWIALGQRWLDQQAFVAVAHITYLCGKHEADSVQDLPPEIRERLNRALRVDRLRWMFSPSSEYFYLMNDPNEFQGYSIHDVLAEIASGILTGSPNRREHGVMSLTKVLERQLGSKSKLGPKPNYPYPRSLRSLRDVWATMASTAVFHLVSREMPKLTLDLNPSDKDFCELVDERLDDPTGIREALAKCKWAQTRLVGRLDPRAREGLEFPSFPDNLREVPLTRFVAAE